MSDEISLLPEGLRGKEQELKKATKPPQEVSELKFSMPSEEGEDIEIIEVDEGEIEQVLANEPFLSRVAYKVTTFLEGVKVKIFQPNAPPPPPKLPPQFFVPPAAKPIAAPTAPKPVPAVGTVSATAPGAPVPAPVGLQPLSTGIRPKAQIMPSVTAPRRVRVIKRVHKPLRVSFVSDEDLKSLHINIPKRRFTFITAVVFFTLLIGGGYALLQSQLQGANDALRAAKDQTAEVQQQITRQQATWSTFQNIEPRLKALVALLDQHVSPTHLLDLIEKNTLPTVSYGSFSLTPDGKVTLSVIADSLESAAGQILAFEQSGFIKKVDASAYAVTYSNAQSLRPSEVTYQVSLTLSETALRPKALAITP